MPSQDTGTSAAGPRDGDSETDGASRSRSETANADRERVSPPSDAFQALGNDVRTGILETMLERDRAADDGRSNVSFSTLFEASDVETSAGFAYHLRQLVGPYVRKCEGVERDGTDGDGGASEPDDNDDGYELTYAGRRVARDIAAGAYTTRVDHPPVGLDDACPFCGREALEARSRDNVVTVACAGCERTLLDLGFPPAGLEAHGEDFPDALDRYHRHRLGRMRDGICPECGGHVSGRLVTPSDAVADELPADRADHAQAELACEACGTTTRCPVALTLLDHAAVVSFYRDHGRDVDDRPIWNVGSEWAERVRFADGDGDDAEETGESEGEPADRNPLGVRVVVELEGNVLALYVDDGLSVIDVQRAAHDSETGTESESESESESEPAESRASHQREPDAADRTTASAESAASGQT